MKISHAMAFALALGATSIANAQSRRPKALPNTSALKFDANHPEVRAVAAQLGWNRPGLKVGIPSADLVYTTDHWKTTHSAPIQYLYNNRQGFLLRGVGVGTMLEYAIHASIGVSHNGFYSYDDKEDVWLNSGGYGKNYTAKTTDPTGQ